jgi:hypothetical protein
MANIQVTTLPEPKMMRPPEPQNELRQFFSYLYFLRFSLALWLSLPGLLGLYFGVPSLAHGIFALERPTHFFYAAFFVTIAGCVALLNARITCAYGEQRFGVAPPKAFAVRQDMRWRTFVLSQVPGLIVLAAICAISIYEASSLEVVQDGLVLMAGIAAALAIWILISTFYYWTHRQPDADLLSHGADPVAPDPFSPTAFLVPGVAKLSFLLRLHKTQPPPFARMFGTFFIFSSSWGGTGYQDETLPPEVVVSAPWRWLLKRLPFVNGDRYCKTGIQPLLPGHALSIVLAFLWLLIYVGLLPFTSPVPLPTATRALAILFAALAALWVLAFALSRNGESSSRKHIVAGRIVEYGVPLLLLTYLPASYAAVKNMWPFVYREIPVFPSIAAILMLLIISCWILCGMAFFFDRFRIPVLTTAALLLFAFHSFVHAGGWLHSTLDSFAIRNPSVSLPIKLISYVIPNPKDHFIDFACAPEICAVPPALAEKIVSPKDILAARLHAHHSAPLIIVTATGGGIHAAAWTAEVLAGLENAFAARQQDFHGSLLLISSVSGGSVGAVPFVRSYFTPQNFAHMRRSSWMEPKQSSQRWWSKAESDENAAPGFISAASRSSLEAVSWGIVYPDMFRLLIPSRTVLGIGDLERYDRGWAMQQRMARNMNTVDCPATSDALRGVAELPSSQGPRANRADQCLTLRELSLAASSGKLPAVTFNTTTAENGSRFLLANYQTAPSLNGRIYGEPPLPAESFLHAYSSSPYDLRPSQQQAVLYPDLEILSAARLSATFPYVSPMPRVPRVLQHESVAEVFAKSLHFADGGYYDNDGTASAIEFLYEAFWNEHFANPVPILWIEIRDDGDFHEGVNPDQCTSQIASGTCPLQNNAGPADATKPSAPLSQTTAPLGAFWKAGHTSVTLRNHREMALLANAFSTQFTIKHAEIAFHKGKNDVQPLSWHLTGREKKDLLEQIRCRGPELLSIADWFSHSFTTDRPENVDIDPRCKVQGH